MAAGGSEAAVTILTIAAFYRMGALAMGYNDNPEAASRPFDLKRTGFVMSEGAGILALEELDHALARGAKIYARNRRLRHDRRRPPHHRPGHGRGHPLHQTGPEGCWCYPGRH